MNHKIEIRRSDKIVGSLSVLILAGLVVMGVYGERLECCDLLVAPWIIIVVGILSALSMTVWMAAHAIFYRPLKRRVIWLCFLVIGTYVASFVYYIVIYRKQSQRVALGE